MICFSECSLSFIQYGGGPELSAESCCIDCVIDFAKSITSAGCFKNERMKIRRILEDSGGSSRLIREFYISKTWYHRWMCSGYEESKSFGSKF